MDNQNYTTAFLVDQTPAQVFAAVNNVEAWWIDKIDGQSKQLGDEFSVQFWDVHYSKQKLIEVVPDQKVAWLVTDSRLTFLEDQSEWTGAKIIFDISAKGDKTELRFTQEGLTPQVECYDACSGAWSGYINNSLRDLITTGKGQPTKKAEMQGA